MDEIEQRLRESTDACIKSYEAWRAKEKDSTVRETLHEAVHELRKVASRLEIEMAISERGDMAGRPLPIPPHRSSQRPRSEGESYDDSSDNAGNVDPHIVENQAHGHGQSHSHSHNQNRSRNNNRHRRPQNNRGGE